MSKQPKYPLFARSRYQKLSRKDSIQEKLLQLQYLFHTIDQSRTTHPTLNYGWRTHRTLPDYQQERQGEQTTIMLRRSAIPSSSTKERKRITQSHFSKTFANHLPRYVYNVSFKKLILLISTNSKGLVQVLDVLQE